MNRSILFLLLPVAIFALFITVFTDVFVYIVIALVITAVLSPIVNKISKLRVNQYHLPRMVAVFISFGLLFFAVYFFIMLFIPLVSDQIEIMKGIEYSDSSSEITDFENYLIHNGYVKEQPGFINAWILQNKNHLLKSIDISKLLSGVFSFTGSVFVGLLAVFFFSVFFLNDKTLVERFILGAVPNRLFEIAITIYNKIQLLLGHYLVGLVVQMFLIFCVVSIGLSIVGVKYAFTIALFSAVANLIPYIGPWIGAAFGLWVSISTGADVDVAFNLTSWTIFRVLIVYAIVQLMDNILFQPMIFSKSVKAHPLEIFVVIFAGGILFGPMGMIIAIPGYTLIKVFMVEVYFGIRRYHVFQK